MQLGQVWLLQHKLDRPTDETDEPRHTLRDCWLSQVCMCSWNGMLVGYWRWICHAMPRHVVSGGQVLHPSYLYTSAAIQQPHCPRRCVSRRHGTVRVATHLVDRTSIGDIYSIYVSDNFSILGSHVCSRLPRPGSQLGLRSCMYVVCRRYTLCMRDRRTDRRADGADGQKGRRGRQSAESDGASAYRACSLWRRSRRVNSVVRRQTSHSLSPAAGTQHEYQQFFTQPVLKQASTG